MWETWSEDPSIDIFAASAGVCLQEITQHYTLETPLNLSSHDPIKTAISIDGEESNDKDKFSNTYTGFIRKKIVWDSYKLPEYQQLAEQALADALHY